MVCSTIIYSVNCFLSTLILFSTGDDEAEQMVYALEMLNEHHEHCIEFQTQQMLDDGVRDWFQGTTRAGLRPADALIVYENFVLYGRATADPEVCSV